MSSDFTLARPAAPSPADSSLLDSSWAARSSEELREIVQHGLRDESFADAIRELERRARAGTEQAEHAVEVDKAHHRSFVRYLILGLALVALAGLILGLFVI